jgi:hypothetical protein
MLTFFIQISAAKSKVLKYLDDIEERLITEVASVQEKINREKLEICQLTSILKDNKQELEPIWTSVCISQFILEDGGILDPMMDLQVEIL